jgi:hypothetical protein
MGGDNYSNAKSFEEMTEQQAGVTQSEPVTQESTEAQDPGKNPPVEMNETTE